jgi:hypothetical protein
MSIAITINVCIAQTTAAPGDTQEFLRLLKHLPHKWLTQAAES